MNERYELVVVGAGVVGLTMAGLLARGLHGDRLNLTLIDAGARPGFRIDDDISLRVSAIAPGSAAILSEIGVWESIISTRACAYRDMRVWDAGGSIEGPETLRFDAAEFAVPQLGHIVENVLIQDALLRQLESLQCSILFDTSIGEFARNGRRFDLKLDDGRELAADILIGADGARSFVRSQAGIDVHSWRYPQVAFVTHLQPEIGHRHTAWQRFLKAGPVALLPLADGRVSTVWSTTSEQAQAAREASDDELGRMLSIATDEVLGKLTPQGPRGVFPLRAQHAERYVLPGLALIGDAAHSVHPLAGQGANLGIADAACLASLISEAFATDEHPGDLPLLRRYERARKGANKTMLHFIDGINRLFSTDAAALARMRGAGMALFNRSGPFRRHAVQVALGINRAGRLT